MVKIVKKKHRIGIIGCGNIAELHLAGIIESPDLEVGALCDIDPGKLSIKQKQCSAADDMCYTDYIKMLDSGRIDAVSICVANSLHFEVASETIKRGIPYALEKPACSNEDEASILLRETEKHGIPNMLCFSYRFEPAARYARDIILSGELGKIAHISVEYYQSWGLPAHDGSLVPLNWRFVKEESSGALGDLGCHMIDMCRFMTGLEFVRVMADMDTFIQKRPIPNSTDGSYGEVTVDDYVNIAGQMEGLVATNISITRLAYGRGNHQCIEVYGEKGGLRYLFEWDKENVLEVNIGNKPMRDNRIWACVPIPKKYNSSQMQAFADILNNCGDGLAADISDGYKCQQVVDSVLASSEKGVRIYL